MQTTDQLTQALGNLALNSAHQPDPDENGNATSNPHHLLTFDYPAIDLLNDVLEVYLPEPHLVIWRPRPQALMFHLAMWSPMSLFYTMDPTAPNYDISQVDNEKAASFVRTVDALRKSSGSTTMSIVVHVQKTVPEILIRLSTTFDKSSTTKTTFWDLNLTDWQAIMAISHPWIEVLGDVVYRKTTRSFLAAEEKLEQHCPILHREDNRQWADQWGSGSANPAKKLLIKYLRYLHSDRVLPFDQLEQDGGTIQLPCGHDLSITKEQIENSTEAECMNATCTFCHTRILPTEQYEEAKMCEQSYNILEAATLADAWTGLDREVVDSRTRTLSKTAVMQALPVAIASLKLPEIIESTHMSPASFPQTSIALRAFQKWFEEDNDWFEEEPQQQEDTIQQSPWGLAFDLQGDVERLIVAEGLGFPPTWRKFIRVAINRAVNLATLRRCSKLGGGHEGVHMHGRKVFVSVPYELSGDSTFEMGEMREALDVEMDDD
ncbi:hypothetical protein M409DRAFT_53788 [Zasmidium cellare ATCC 36951]|uniref:Uncharacterized protein n=1 Tax=Zasmidium cellare ATCC 36951 TaxID=1080233 RepID=A0A6A6CPY2_ZASCE|nr:uncharacterized protein M409DRAFT_53788 [Zasmidium cellare ATCC 36951]KAF2167829.1 hypothetical protein M409DRAFT_53788 [Zasmidium cellare ATCC 36951]